MSVLLFSRIMLRAFMVSVFIVNALGLCLLLLHGDELAPEISQDSNPHLPNLRHQRYNSAFLTKKSPFCVLVSFVGVIARTLTAEEGQLSLYFLPPSSMKVWDICIIQI